MFRQVYKSLTGTTLTPELRKMFDELLGKENVSEVVKAHEKGETKAQEKAEHVSGKEKKEKSEMKEAIPTIQALHNELNEVTLLNAKLLYVNKIFKSKNLTESQKVHVIASFDKATNVRESTFPLF